MMIRPDAGDLLQIARKTLLDDLLPELPAGLRYKALMVANAMAIATREYHGGEAADTVEAQLLEQMLGTREPSLTDARQALCRAIRHGQFDKLGSDQEHLFMALSAITQAQLAISNPKALAS